MYVAQDLPKPKCDSCTNDLNVISVYSDMGDYQYKYCDESVWNIDDVYRCNDCNDLNKLKGVKYNVEN